MFELWRLGLLKILGGMFIFAMAPAAYSTSNHPESSFQFRPGVIVASGEKPTIYLMSPQGSVEAIELHSGKRRWGSTEAVRPLLLHKKYLITQAEAPETQRTLRIVGLDAEKGKKLFHTDVKLPQGVQALVDDRPGTSFHLNACQYDDKVYISWLYQVLYVGGVAPEQTVNPKQQTAGHVYLDIQTGQADEIAGDQIPCQIGAKLPDRAAQLIKSNRISGRAWYTGKILATTSRIHGEGSNRTVLERWDLETGKALPAVTLFEGNLSVRYASIDNRYLLASGPDVATGDMYQWKIFSLETGDLMADVRSEILAARFYLSDPYLIHDLQAQVHIVDGGNVFEPLRLRAIDLRSGTEVWNRPLRDTRYRGTYPPSLGAGQKAPMAPGTSTP